MFVRPDVIGSRLIRRASDATLEGTPKRRSASNQGASRQVQKADLSADASRPAHAAERFRMKRASSTRVLCGTAGGAGASVPPGRVKSATSGPTSSPQCAWTAAMTSPWRCLASTPRSWTCFPLGLADTLVQDAHAVMMCDRRRLARRARPHRPRQRHLGAVDALQSRTQPRRAGLDLPTRTLPIEPRPRRHRGHGRTRCCQAWFAPHAQNRIVCKPSAPIHGS